uniref:DnaJ homolog subfamily C member 11 n=1 Tax=Sinocyclocheilus grahami TaxID=75366 RepID=A0A672QS27_SINGR
MAAALENELGLDNEDYYSLLNVRREATQDELKSSYRRLCMLYHPDKHRDPELKRQAEQLFTYVHQAYEVLSDPQSRAIYDIFGKKGLEVEGWEVVERKRTPAEIREEYERLQRERDERRLQQRTNPKVDIPDQNDKSSEHTEVANKRLNGTSEAVWDIKHHADLLNRKTHLLTSPLSQPHCVFNCTLMTTSIVRDTKTSHFTLALQLGVPHSYLMMSYQYKFQDEDQTKVKGSIKTGFFGTLVEYGAERKISRHSVVAATVSIGVPQGVSLKIRLNRASQTYLFPIHLTDQILPSAVFYATVGPLAIYLAVQKLIIMPYVRAQKEQELEKQKEVSASEIARRKQEAEAAVLLMQESVKRIIDAEESKMGLIILNAWYGKFVSDNSQKHESAKVIDVTVPLQCLVKDSKLILTEASKAGLPGFYDPCVGEEKSLKLLYQFRGAMHQVLSGDTEPLKIPKQCEYRCVDIDGCFRMFVH